MDKHAADISERPPIVAVLGHVDHGKSTLLDFIRKSNTVEREAGGITQKVAAYEVEHPVKAGAHGASGMKQITFIDTPGHAAFRAIRARGAKAADIAILVVAADDGVKAQTLEALESIKEAGIPFVVAINKIDKPNANVERTQGSLAEHGVYLEKLGGDVPWTAISAKNGTGVGELLDLILLVAEVEELKADRTTLAQGSVIEAHRDQKRGIAATLIILEGTLKIGMAIVAGSALSPVRIMEDYRGKSVKEAGPSKPVTIVGFDELPEAGAEFKAYKNKKEAEVARAAYVLAHPRATAYDAPASEEESDHFSMPIIIRADTAGSQDAIVLEVGRLASERASIAIVKSGIGDISEDDVKAAIASGTTSATIFGFNVAIDPRAETLARQKGVSFEFFDVIYTLTDRLEALLEEYRPKRKVEEVVGRARILKVFSTRKAEHLIGGKVESGYLARKAQLRITRRAELVGIGTINTIETNRQKTDRVETGQEFGSQIEADFEVAQGDMLECFIVKEE